MENNPLNKQKSDAMSRNLISSLVALNAEDDETMSCRYKYVLSVIENHDLLRKVDSGKALLKFHNRVISMISNNQKSFVVNISGWKLMRTIVDQSPPEVLNKILPIVLDKSFNSIKRILKQGDESSLQDSVIVSNLQTMRVLVSNQRMVSSDVRREFVGHINKMVSQLLSLLSISESSNKSGDEIYLYSEDVVLSSLEVLNELMDQQPNSLRSLMNRIERKCLDIINIKNKSISRINDIACQCIARCATHVSQNEEAWRSIMVKSVFSLHRIIDLLSGEMKKCYSSLPWNFSNSPNTEISDDEKFCLIKINFSSDISDYEKAELLVTQFKAITCIIENCLKQIGNPSKLDIIAPYILDIIDRIIGINADETGKQSAVSMDGIRLPTSVLYGFLPTIQIFSMRILSMLLQAMQFRSIRLTSRIGSIFKDLFQREKDDITYIPSVQREILCALSESVSILGQASLRGIIRPAIPTILCIMKNFNDLRKERGENSPYIINASGKKGGSKRKRNTQPIVEILPTNHTNQSLSSSHIENLCALNAEAVNSLRCILAKTGSMLSNKERNDISKVLIDSCKTIDPLVSSSKNTLSCLKAMLVDSIVPRVSRDRAVQLTEYLPAIKLLQNPSNRDIIEILTTVIESYLHPRSPPLQRALEIPVDKTEIDMSEKVDKVDASSSDDECSKEGDWTSEEEENMTVENPTTEVTKSVTEDEFSKESSYESMKLEKPQPILPEQKDMQIDATSSSTNIELSGTQKESSFNMNGGMDSPQSSQLSKASQDPVVDAISKEEANKSRKRHHSEVSTECTQESAIDDVHKDETDDDEFPDIVDDEPDSDSD